MKKAGFVLLAGLFLAGRLFAQEGKKFEQYDGKPASDGKPEPVKGFDLNKLFVGGSIGLGYGGGSGGSSFFIGGFPQVGYSVLNWLDAGISFNASFTNIKYSAIDVKQNSFNYGAGVFVRGFPFNGFFIQAQPEYNWIKYKYKDPYNTEKATVHASSLLLGVGYGTRDVGRSGFFTVIMIDALSNQYSPYRDTYNNIIPVIRGGFYVYLRPKSQRDR